MNNKHGDKVEAITPPKPNSKTNEPTHGNSVPDEVIVKPKKEVKIERPKSNFAQRIENEQDEANAPKSISEVRSTLIQYLTLFKEKSCNTSLNKAQMTFHNLLLRVARKEFSIFKKEWTEILDFIEEHPNDINLVTINYGINLWNVDRPVQLGYSTLAYIAVRSAPKSKRREVVRSFDPLQISKDLRGLGSAVSDNIMQYYDI